MLFAAVANNHYAGGGFDVAPLSKIDDGLLDLVAIRSDRGLQLANISKELEDPMNPDNVHVDYRQLSEFTIESEEKLHCNLDGEPLHKKKLRFSVLPRHLRVAF
jgi:diacylglycerol kinase family enzyme